MARMVFPGKEELIICKVIHRLVSIIPFVPSFLLLKKQRSKFEDLIGFIKPFMNQAAPYLKTRRALQHKIEGFLYEEARGARKL